MSTPTINEVIRVLHLFAQNDVQVERRVFIAV